MSLKCSIFGCKYGEREVHRQREEEGSEVVITIRETETCKRCGDVRVVSENKEVTTLETAADIVADDLEDEPTEETTPAPGSNTAPPETAPAESEPRSPTEGRGEEGGGAAIPDAETDEFVTPGGEGRPAADTPEPEPAEDDGVILDEEAESEGQDEGRDPGEWPEESGESDDGWEQPTEAEPTIDGTREFGSTGSVVSVPEGEFYCPECEFTTPVESSSLREGDYCPECHRGSLEHRTE